MNGANSGVDREREPLISSGGPGPDAQDGTTSDDESPSGVASILFCLLFITTEYMQICLFGKLQRHSLKSKTTRHIYFRSFQ